MSQIEDKKVVTLSFVMKDESGAVLDTSDDSGKLHYIHGQSQILPVLEKALAGRIQEEKFTVRFTPDEAYGDTDPHKIWTLPKNRFDDGENLEVGQYFEITAGEDVFHVVIREVGEDDVTVDANHPLAGKTLEFDICVEEIREPSEEELEMILKNDIDNAPS